MIESDAYHNRETNFVNGSKTFQILKCSILVSMDANRDDEHNKQFYDERIRFRNGSKLFSFFSAVGSVRATTKTKIQQNRRNCVPIKNVVRKAL